MILVTGGTGLVGAHLLFELLGSGRKIRALKRKSGDLRLVRRIFSYYSEEPDRLMQQIEWTEGDILDYAGMEEQTKGIDVIYHCAAMVSFHADDRNSMVNNNVQGTANLINAALQQGVKRFCHVSSIAALGKTTDGTEINEETYWTPSRQKTSYSLSKFFSEMEVWRGMEEGLEAVIVNPSIILGPGHWDMGSPKFFQAVWKGLKYYTRGETGFVDVRDVTRAMLLLTGDDHFRETRNQRFILNAGNISYRKFFNRIADTLERPRPKTFASDLILQLAWRGARMASLFSGKRPAITRETVSGSNTINHYNGSKICRLTGFSYRSLEETISDIGKLFLKDLSL
ncbi:MAG: NAD-dependent epimerase/dehydratase family protein [Mangrovibacterium sp.]